MLCYDDDTTEKAKQKRKMKLLDISHDADADHFHTFIKIVTLDSYCYDYNLYEFKILCI